MWPEGFPYDSEQIEEPQFDIVADLAVTTQPLLSFQRHSPTSIAAAKSVKSNVESLREKVYTAISNAYMGLTDAEISLETGLAGNTARPRRIELQRAGRIQGAGP